MTSFFRQVPTDKDWGDLAGDFDAQDAYKKFHGRSKQEAKEMFAKDILSCAQDVRFMPSVPFIYYLQGFCEFVLDGVYGDSPAWAVADSFISVLTSKAKTNPELLVFNLDQISNALTFLVKNQTVFNANEDIYGDFNERAEFIFKYIREATDKRN